LSSLSVLSYKLSTPYTLISNFEPKRHEMLQ